MLALRCPDCVKSSPETFLSQQPQQAVNQITRNFNTSFQKKFNSRINDIHVVMKVMEDGLVKKNWTLKIVQDLLYRYYNHTVHGIKITHWWWDTFSNLYQWASLPLLCPNLNALFRKMNKNGKMSCTPQTVQSKSISAPKGWAYHCAFPSHNAC